MFDGIAERYDLLNDILSAGQVRLWRRAVTRIIGAGPVTVLDLAAGTGTSALSFTATGADCVAAFLPGMTPRRAARGCEVGRKQHAQTTPAGWRGTRLRLPLPGRGVRPR